MRKIWVWDVPTRLFHWSIVALIGFSWWSADNAEMQWHYYSGLTLCALLIFRLLWGFFGTSTARFGQFVKGVGPVIAYVKRNSAGEEVVGHNPLGGWSVLAMLLALVTQVVTGLFAVDIDGLESGPLSYMLEFDQGRAMAKVHEVSFNILLLLVALHIVAIFFYLLVRRINLVMPMVTGRQRASYGNSAVRVSPWRLIAITIVAAAATWWIANGLPL